MYFLQVALMARDSVLSGAPADTAPQAAPLEPWLQPAIIVAFAGVLIAAATAIYVMRYQIKTQRELHVAELLRRDEEQQAEETKQSKEIQIQAETEEGRYRQWVENQHRYLAITGLRTRQPVDVELEKVFVKLSVDPRPLAREAVSGEQLTKGMVDGERLPAEFARSTRHARPDDAPVPVGEALQRISDSGARGLVVLGGPGTGKTTMMKWLALTYAQNRQGERLDDKKERLPIYLALRDVARLVKPGPLHEVVAHANQERECQLSPEFYRGRLAEGRCIVLLDGLDEVADAEGRKRVAQWVQTRCDGLRGNPFVVTCRPAGFREDYLPPGFLRADVLAFTDDDVRDFARNWCVAVEMSSRPDDPDAEAAGKRAAADLVAAVGSNPGVKALAVTPLMLAIIALVHRFRARLPDRRVDLYAECVEVLLGHWDEAKDLLVDIPARKSLQVLQPLALWMHQLGPVEDTDEENQLREAKREDIESVIAPHLQAIGLTEADAGRFLDSVRDRSGLLVERGPDVFGFQHQTFQEYLAAKEIRDRRQFDLLAQAFGEGYWREVSLLCAGIGNATDLVEAILALPDDRLLADWRFLREISGEALSIDQQTRSALANRPLSTLKSSKSAIPAVQSSLWLRKEMPPYEVLVEGFAAAKDELHKAHFALLLADLGDERAIDILKPHLADDRLHLRSVSALALDILGYGDRQVLDDLLMVRISAGDFKMGGKGIGAADLHTVHTDGYLMDRFPLTNGQYARFVDAGGYEDPQWWSEQGWKARKERSWTGPGSANHEDLNLPTAPVVGISQYEAAACAKWMDRRLPTEQEWERAARGDGDDRDYPWGSEWREGCANTSESGIGWPSPVGSFPYDMSQHGLYDTCGNVWEWTSSAYAEDDPDPVVRGGSFDFNSSGARCSVRDWYSPVSRNYFLGVRFSRTLTLNS